jgi:hypothetical protein
MEITNLTQNDEDSDDDDDDDDDNAFLDEKGQIKLF